MEERPKRSSRSRRAEIEVCILAGGLSSRMGRDKARLRLGSETLLQRICRMAAALELPFRIIREDLLPHCGPLGGIYTALKSSRAQAVLFLACDMPFVSTELLVEFLAHFGRGSGILFTRGERGPGFPIAAEVNLASLIAGQLTARDFSLQRLAMRSKAPIWAPPATRARELFNINTPQDLAIARKLDAARR